MESLNDLINDWGLFNNKQGCLVNFIFIQGMPVESLNDLINDWGLFNNKQGCLVNFIFIVCVFLCNH